MNSACGDIPLYSNVRWLSCGKVLEWLLECFDEIRIFLKEKGPKYPELEDDQWVVKLMFLSEDIIKHLSELNLLLQGAGQTVLDLYDTWKAFVAKLAVYLVDIETVIFRYFRHLKGWSAHHPVNVTEFAVYMQELKSGFSASHYIINYPKDQETKQANTLEQKNKVLEALQRGNGVSRVSDASTATPLGSDVDDELV
ncbi:General transcription factor II-I repeat domain-containing protein 2-like 3, partial [Homarus americanus]